MKFIVFELKTNSIGCDATEIYQASEDCFNEDETLNEDYLNEYGYELARDNAESYGLLEESNDGCEPEDNFYATFELVEFDTIEEAEEEYGSVLQF